MGYLKAYTSTYQEKFGGAEEFSRQFLWEYWGVCDITTSQSGEKGSKSVKSQNLRKSR